MKSQRVYLQHILERIIQIERFTEDGRDAFMMDDRTQEAVMRCFEVIGEAVKRLDPDLKAQQPDISWQGFAGFRDVLIHQYDVIDIAKVWEAVQEDIPSLKVAVESLLMNLSKDENTL